MATDCKSHFRYNLCFCACQSNLGYRSLPLPPISRLEGSGQNVKSVKIRRELNAQMLKIMNRYFTTARAVREFSNQDLLRFHEQGKQCDPESIASSLDDFRTAGLEVSQMTNKLKESYVTVQGLRKMFLLSLFCLEPQDASSDYLRFTTALEGLRLCNDVTESATAQIQRALMAEESELKTQ